MNQWIKPQNEGPWAAIRRFESRVQRTSFKK
jgi:hypothetical protein